MKQDRINLLLLKEESEGLLKDLEEINIPSEITFTIRQRLRMLLGEIQ